MYVLIHMKKNLQIWYKFFYTQLYNLFLKKNWKILKILEVIFGGFDKIFFFAVNKLLTMANILRIQKKITKIWFFDGAE